MLTTLSAWVRKTARTSISAIEKLMTLTLTIVEMHNVIHHLITGEVPLIIISIEAYGVYLTVWHLRRPTIKSSLPVGKDKGN